MGSSEQSLSSFKKVLCAVMLISILLVTCTIPVFANDEYIEDMPISSTTQGVPTEQEMYEHIDKQEYVSTIFQANIDAYTLYPNNSDFVNGVERSAINLIRWSQRQHARGNINETTARYSMILNADGVPEYLVEATKISQSAADRGQVLTFADDMYTYAQKQQYVSTIFEAYVAGYKLYPYESRFVQGVETSARNLLNWSSRQHRAGNYDAARARYNLILSRSDEVRINDIVNTARNLRDLANLRVMPTAQEQYDWAESKTTVSTIFNEHLRGARAYPGDVQAIQGLEKSSINLLRWSQRQHARGNIQQATARYSMILSAEEVPGYLVDATKVSQNAADKGQIITFADDMYAYAQKQQYVSTIFEAYVDGYKLYPYESRFAVGLDKSANNLYNWASRKHDKGEYETAIIRYELIIKAPGVKNSLKEKTRSSLESAQKSLEQNALFTYTQYGETFSSVLNKQMNRNPQTDLYGNGWESAKQSEVAYHMDPTNFVHPQYSQGGDTGSKRVEITASALNVRTGPSTLYPSITQVSSGGVYPYSEVKDGWYKIWVNNRFGWVSGDYVKDAPSGGVTVDSPPSPMYQFLVLSGSSGISASEINAELVGKGIFEGRGQAFLDAGQTYNVNEIYLLAHALLETGNGRSELANGVMVNYVDGVPVEPRMVYNMYGIGARDAAPVRLGSEYAYKQNWFTPEEAIIDGARWIENGYINNASYKQDTLYKMRWNPVSPGVHQYATDIGWALKQTANMNLVSDICLRYNIQMKFDIPVYR